MNFKEWLINKGFSIVTASSYSYFTGKKFALWLHENQVSIEYLEHEHVMQYIRFRKSCGVQSKTINLELKQISYYLEFKELPNVAGPIRIKAFKGASPMICLPKNSLTVFTKSSPKAAITGHMKTR